MLCGRNRSDTPILPVTHRPTTNHNPNRPTSIHNPSRPSSSAHRPTEKSPHSVSTQPSYGQQQQHCSGDDAVPRNGYAEYLINDVVHRLAEDDVIEQYGSINYTCHKNYYIIRGTPWNICLNGAWKFPKPVCEPRCNSTEVQGVTISANCYSLETQRISSCVQPVPPGTRATISCRRGYEYDDSEQTLDCESDGRWTPEPRRCSPICGKISEGECFCCSDWFHVVGIIVL